MGYPLGKASKKLAGNGNAPKKLVPGLYNSEIISVKEAPGHAPGEAFILKRRLIPVNGSGEYEKDEKLIWNLDNPRTLAFISYLESNGVVIDNSDQLIGLQEILEYWYKAIGGHPYPFLNIREETRQFVGFASNKEVDEA